MKLRYPIMLSSLLVVSAYAELTSAADQQRAERMESELKTRFAKADANGDGQLTRDEAKGTMPRVYANFDKIDVSHHGYVTVEDIESFMMDKMAARKGEAEK